MKILWLTEFLPKSSESKVIGGVQVRCFHVAKYLNENNSVEVIEGAPEKYAKASFGSFFTRLFYLPGEILKGLRTNFDIVEASNFVMYLPAWFIARFKGKPLVLWYPDVYVGSWVKNVGLVGLIGEFVERTMLVLKADHYIAISNTVKDKLLDLGVPNEKISVIYCGISKEEIEKVKTSSKKQDLITVSRLIKYKRINEVLEVSKDLKNENINTKTVIIGWGDERQNLENQAKKFNLDVTFLGTIDSHLEVLKEIKKSKILCHPSVVEGFGISIIEALALGVPVILPSTKIANEITKGGKGVEFYDSGNISHLKETLKKLLFDTNLYSKKSKEGIELSKEYSWEKIAKETENLYEKILKS